MARTARLAEGDRLVTVTRVFTIPAPAKLLSLNAERRMHWARRAEIVREWRAAAKLYARHERIPAFAWAEFEFEVWQSRGVAADCDSFRPCTKAIEDGLVDAGVLPDDSGEYLRGVINRPPRRAQSDCVRVTIRGELTETNERRG